MTDFGLIGRLITDEMKRYVFERRKKKYQEGIYAENNPDNSLNAVCHLRETEKKKKEKKKKKWNDEKEGRKVEKQINRRVKDFDYSDENYMRNKMVESYNRRGLPLGSSNPILPYEAIYEDERLNRRYGNHHYLSDSDDEPVYHSNTYSSSHIKEKIKYCINLIFQGDYEEAKMVCSHDEFLSVCRECMYDLPGISDEAMLRLVSYLKTGGEDDSVDVPYKFNVFCQSDEEEKYDMISKLFNVLNTPYVVQIQGAARKCKLFVNFIGSKLWKHIDEGCHVLWKNEIPHNFLKVKRHSGASSKVNMTFYGVMRGIKSNAPKVYELLKNHSNMLYNLYDDQGAAVALYVCGTYKILGDLAICFAFLPFIDATVAKDLSSFLKATGMNSGLHGAVVCELQTLLGRGVNEINAVDEALKRCKASCIPYTGINNDDLRTAVREIIKNELGACTFANNAEFWSKRWLWCANGAHNKMLERLGKKYAVKDTRRLYRKVAAESWQDDLTLGWDGETVVTPSQKLEHGKSRLLLACDTVSYMSFEHLLSGIEDAWRGDRVILDPGKLSNYDVRDFCWSNNHSGRVCMAMDYDDFNSQHTLEAQKIVIDETIKLSGYDKMRGDALVNSFEKMFVHTTLGTRRKVVGTLLSGHRGTTYLNSVLNAAYIKCAIGNIWYNIRSLHIGDDVMMVVDDRKLCSEIVERIYMTKLKLNPSKQSIGSESAELLRIAHGVNNESYGYYARAVASAVSGNWVSEKILTMKERLTTCITSSWTLMNRCGGDIIVGKVVAHNVSKCCDISFDDAIDLCTGRVAINNGPIRHVTSQLVTSVGIKDEITKKVDVPCDDCPQFATDNYIEMQLTTLERELFGMQNETFKTAMKASSYRKAVCAVGEVLPATLVKKRENAPSGVEDVRILLKERVKKGVLEKHPVINLMKDSLDQSTIKHLMRMCGYVNFDDEEVWGANARPCIVNKAMTYSEAASACRHGRSCVLSSNCSIYA